MRKSITRSQKITALVVLLLSTLILVLLPNAVRLLTSCPPPGNPSLTIVRDEDSPIFDFHPKQLTGTHDPFGYEIWQIWKLDQHGRKVKCLWEISPPKGGPYFLDTLVYSKTPASWREVKSPEPLESDNTFYLTAGGFLFLKDKNGGYHVLGGNYYSSAEIANRLSASDRQ